MSDDIRCRTAGTSRQDHQADGQLAGQAEKQREREGNGRQQDELAGEPNEFRFGMTENAAEILWHEAESHTEKHGE